MGNTINLIIQFLWDNNAFRDIICLVGLRSELSNACILLHYSEHNVFSYALISRMYLMG